MAINRDAIADRIMEKQAVPAGQFLPDYLLRHQQEAEARPSTTRSGAKKLLAEAGLPERLRGDAARAQQPLHQRREDRAGDRAVPTARRHRRPRSRPCRRASSSRAASKLEFSLLLAGWGSETGETGRRRCARWWRPSTRTRATGAANRGRFSDPALDAMIDAAMIQIDAGQARVAARRGQREGDGRAGDHPAALRGFDLGDEEGPGLRRPRRPVHLRLRGHGGTLTPMATGCTRLAGPPDGRAARATSPDRQVGRPPAPVPQ